MENFKEQALQKLDRELSKFKSSNNKASAVKQDVYKTLKNFAEQDHEFAQAIVQSSKTLARVCEASVKGCSSSISDFDCYSKAVAEYFPGAKIHFNMTIDLVGEAAAPTDNIINLSLGDLLGGI